MTGTPLIPLIDKGYTLRVLLNEQAELMRRGLLTNVLPYKSMKIFALLLICLTLRAGDTNVYYRATIQTNIYQSRLTDMPTVLCTITNRVLAVEGKHYTNTVVLERLGAWCEEVAVPSEPVRYQFDNMIVTPTTAK